MGYSYYRIDDTSVNENSGYANFSITRTGDTSYAERVYAYTSNGSASSYSDYNSTRNYVYFDPYETSKTFSVRINDDTYAESTENFRVQLSSSGRKYYPHSSYYYTSYTRISDSSGYATIYDNDQYGNTSFSVADTSVTEGEVGKFIVSRSGDLREAGSVNYQLTSESGNVTTGSIYFSAGASSGTINFSAQENYIHGDNKQISVQLTGSSLSQSSVSFSDATAQATVVDDDPKPLGTSYFSVEADPVKEGLTGVFTVRRIGELSTAGQVIYRLTAPNGTSFSRFVSFGENQETGTISVATQDNSTHGPNGSYKIQLLKAALFENTADIASADAVMAVLDDDPIPNRGSARFTIAGGSEVGSTKSIRLAAADPNGNGAFTHTWQQNNAGQWSDIGKGGSFTLRDAQEGKQIRAITTYVDANGFSESVVTTAGQVASRPLVMAREGLFDGNTVTLEFNRELDDTSVGNSRFQVKAGRRKMRVQGVDVNGTEGTVDIRLNRDVTYYDDLLITYKDLLGDQTSGVVQDVNGNDLKSLSSFKVSNSYAGPTGGQSEPLELIGAEYADGQVELELNDEITNHSLNKRRFKVWADNKRMKVTNAEVVDDAFVTLDVAARNGRVITDNTVMKLSYSDMRGDQSKGVIEDLAGFDLDTVNKMEVDILA